MRFGASCDEKLSLKVDVVQCSDPKAGRQGPPSDGNLLGSRQLDHMERSRQDLQGEGARFWTVESYCAS